MARANQAGKNWARITSTVFFGIDCLALLLILVGAGVAMHAVSPSVKIVLVAAVVAGIVTWVIGLVTIVLLWRSESSEYYAAMRGR
jgi:membrane protein YdbS with pleckstrin-like domain